ncbi:Chromo domain-containing protein, partial [Cephalotus follicularis]
NAYSSSLKLC